MEQCCTKIYFALGRGLGLVAGLFLSVSPHRKATLTPKNLAKATSSMSETLNCRISIRHIMPWLRVMPSLAIFLHKALWLKDSGQARRHSLIRGPQMFRNLPMVFMDKSTPWCLKSKLDEQKHGLKGVLMRDCGVDATEGLIIDLVKCLADNQADFGTVLRLKQLYATLCLINMNTVA